MSLPTFNNQEPSNKEHVPPSRFDLAISGHNEPAEKLSSGVWQADTHQPATELEKQVERTLFWRFFFGSVLFVLVSAVLLGTGIEVVKKLTYVDDFKPDYSALDPESDRYWEERTKIDIQTARDSKSTFLQNQRIQRFINQSIKEAMFIDSNYNRITAVATIAVTLARNDVDLTIDEPLERLGTSSLALSMRCRVLVSQALMYLRLKKFPSAKVLIAESNRLSVASDQRLNSKVNEDTFFGTVTVFAVLPDSQDLPAFFRQQLEFVLVLSLDQQNKAFRLIAGEQMRTGMINDAVSTFKRIRNPVEMARTLELLLAYSGRPPQIKITEPEMLVLPTEATDKPMMYPDRAKNIVREVFHWIGQTADAQTQLELLRQVADSRLMCDREMYSMFKESVTLSPDFSDAVKQPVLHLLDNPQSPAIRAALNLPEREDLPKMNTDTVFDDWTTSEEVISVPVEEIDASPMLNRLDRQSVQTLLLTGQSYLMFNRSADAVRVLRKAAAAAQKMQKPDERIDLLQRVGEQQIAAGTFTEAKKTLHSVLAIPEAAPQQLAELARLQIIGRFFADALATLKTVSEPELRDNVYRFLAMEQLRIHRLDAAAATLALMSKTKSAAEVQRYLNIAGGKGTDADFAACAIPNPAKQNGDQELGRCCERLIQSGLLHLAGQTLERISGQKEQSRLRSRLVREYLLLCNTYQEEPEIRQYVQNEAFAAAELVAEGDRTALWSALLDRLSMQIQGTSDRESARKLWDKTLTACRALTKIDERACCLAELLLAKIALEKTQGSGTYPYITKEANPMAFEETVKLVDECRQCIELIDTALKQGKPCALLAKALVQVGRMKAANSLLEQTRELAAEMPDSAETTELYLMIVPVYQSLNESAAIPEIFETAIRTVTSAFTEKIQSVNILDWRLRDSSIDSIIRSMMEYGFV
ncbi:MAG: hypothetical protein LBT89_00345, partial [Planctomycetaceae bacterium]|nr:hypothetical protein [Planctomycetaceae bacterium]